MEKRGGKREGAGRRKLPEEEQKIIIHTKLDHDWGTWLKNQGQPINHVIEMALKLAYGKPPKF